jgi:hypothetical protein
MKADASLKLLLLVIAVSLAAIALRPYWTPSPVMAQSDETHAIYVEPGVAMLRAPDGSQQVLGRVVIDMRNGNVWGFPTFTQDVYPVNTGKSTPPTSHPFLLGKFALSDMDK